MKLKLRKQYIYVLIVTLIACIAAVMCLNFSSVARADEGSGDNSYDIEQITAINSDGETGETYSTVADAVGGGIVVIVSTGTDGYYNGYNTLQDAFDAATDGATIILIDDNIGLSEYVTINWDSDVWSAKSDCITLTLDLNGKTITLASEFDSVLPTNSEGVAIRVYNANLTIIDSAGNGGIDGSAVTNAGNSTGEINLLSVQADGTLIIEAGTYTISNASGACVYAFKDGSIIINGGTFTNSYDDNYPYSDGGEPLVVNQANVSDQLVTINGGTFIGRNPAFGDDSSSGASTFISEDVTLYEGRDDSDNTAYYVGNDESVVPTDVTIVASYSVNDDGSVVTANYAYSADEITSQLEAGAEYIIIGADIELTSALTISNSVTIDLNGKTLTGKDDHTIINYGILIIVDSVGGSIVTNTVSKKAALYNAVGATAYIKGGTYTRGTDNDYYVIQNQGTMYIYDGVTMLQPSSGSSGIASGYYTPDSEGVTAYLTIYGGMFASNAITVKNGEISLLIIYGGTFDNVEGYSASQSLQNWSEATLEGGEYHAMVISWSEIDGDVTKIKSSLTINGGTYYYVAKYNYDSISKSSTYVEDGGADIAIYDGTFEYMPATSYFAEGYGYEYDKSAGTYTVVYIGTEVKGAQADVRTYMSTNGWNLSYIRELAANEGSKLYSAASAVVAAYEAISEVITSEDVVSTRLEAMDAVDELVNAFNGLKEGAIKKIEETIKEIKEIEEETSDVVTVPTATYAAIYSATTESDVEYLLEAALMEIDAIHTHLNEISEQTTKLEKLAEALNELSDDLFNDESGAIASAVESILSEINYALAAIVGTDGSADSVSLAEIYEYLSESIYELLDEIEDDTNLAEDIANISVAINSVLSKLSDMEETVGGIVAAAAESAENEAELQTSVNDVQSDIAGVVVMLAVAVVLLLAILVVSSVRRKSSRL